MAEILSVKDLGLSFESEDQFQEVLSGVSFSVAAGEIVGIIGESGSGKSMTARSITRLLPDNALIAQESQVRFKGEDVLAMKPRALRRLLGQEIGMIFQDPLSSLNPTMTVGAQIVEVLRLHRKLSRRAARDEAVALMSAIGILEPAARFKLYPHEFSGGMRQRIMIAIALAGKPSLLIADEPTTALDVTIQAQILRLIKDLQADLGLSVLLISHDFGVVAQICTRVIVMQNGRIVEQGPIEELFAAPKHPYTKLLLDAVPRIEQEKVTRKVGVLADVVAEGELVLADEIDPDDGAKNAGLVATEVIAAGEWPGEWPVATNSSANSNANTSTIAKANTNANTPLQPLISVEKLEQVFDLGKGQQVKAVNQVDLKIYRGETLGLVGESGSGKSTLGRAILQLYQPTSGRIMFHGFDLKQLTPTEKLRVRKDMQIIFQDPYASLDPRMKVEDIIGEALDTHGLVKNANERRARVEELLELVELDPSFASRFPHEFSGGQRQRIGIARALAVEPDFIVADEPLSALDVSIQAQIIDLLQKLQEKLGLTYLFIAHDLAVVKQISDRVAVMQHGQIVEIAETKELYDKPLHPYTQQLLSAVPRLDAQFRASQPEIKDAVPASQTLVNLVEVSPGHFVAH